jgi:Tfp pilus assembly protein PilO
MRIQDIFGSLANRWIAVTIIVWVITLAIATSNGWFYFETKLLCAKIDHTKHEIEVLSEKKRLLNQERVELEIEDKKLSMILTDLLTACKKSGVYLGETKVAHATEHEDYASLPITISIKGSYNQIGKFLNLIEKTLRFKVLEVGLSTKETKSQTIVGKIFVEFMVL